MTDTAALSRELTVLVADIDGVALLYPADAAAAATDLVSRVERMVGAEVSTPQLVSVESHDDAMRVRVRIAISEAASARDVCSRVYDAVRAHLAPAAIDSIEVRVGSIG